MRILLFIFLFFACQQAALADEIFVCKCDTGAHGSCVAGSDANNGLTAATPKLTRPNASATNALPANSSIHFCQGGYWDNEPMVQFEGYNFTAAAPLTFDSYVPPSGATGRPTFRAAGNNPIWQTGGFFDTTWRGGYIWRGLKMLGVSGNGTAGIFFNKYVQDIIIDDVWFEAWYSGLLWSVDAGQTRCQRMIVRNSTFYRNPGNGYLGSCSDFTVEDNLFEENNAGGTALQHAMYHGSRSVDSRTIVRRNRIINNSLNGSNICTSGNLTIRGDKDQTLIEDNYIYVPNGSPVCYGISITSGYGDYNHEVMYRTVIRGNTIVGVGRCMELQITPAVIVENNRCYQNSADNGTTGINISVSDQEEVIYPPTGAILKNNSVYLSSAVGNGACISFVPGSGNSFQVFNNLCQVGATSTARCWNNLQLISNYAVWDYNQCYNQGTGGYSEWFGNLAEAQGNGFDTNGLASNPVFNALTVPATATDTSTMMLTGSSPGRVAGRNTGKPPRDFQKCQRSATPSIGAHEYNGTPCLTVSTPIVR